MYSLIPPLSKIICVYLHIRFYLLVFLSSTLIVIMKSRKKINVI